jgi:CDP-diacylglycerol--glycerol-3-phosphate 3-phosphatidyltransferase
LGNLAAAGLFIYAGQISTPEAPAYDWVGWAGLTIILSSLFDMLDGQVARIGGMASTFGAMYDSVLDRYCELVTLGGICFFLNDTGYGTGAIITFAALVGSIMVSYVRARAEGLDVECKVGLMQRPERVVLTSVGAILCGLFADACRDSFDPMWFLLVPQIIIAVLANYTAFVRINHVRKQLKNK